MKIVVVLKTLTLATVLGCSGVNSSEDAPPVLLKKRVDFQQFESLIEQKMNSQEDAWNRGDLEGFMNGYWHSDSLKFIGKSGLTYGWDTTLANYKKSYPDTDAMGRLTFDNLSIEMIDSDVILVIGKWMLARNTLGDTLQGHYSLNWQKKDGDWVIVVDHSS